MESGSSCQTGEQPPALPAKQHSHRSLSYRGSSVGSDSGLLSPIGLQPQNFSFNDVFAEPAYCHAPLCPIHQGLGLEKHQVRCLSDGTPPPVPKKRLARTLSLPGPHLPPLSPLASQPPRQPHNFDNPLYMLAPIQDTHFSQESSVFADTRPRPAPLLPLSQLCFDTPDEHLLCFFGGFEDQGTVYETIQQCHLVFLGDMEQNIEAKLLLQVETFEKPVSSYQPQDFLLDEASEPKRVGGTLYYSVHSPKFPGRILGLRICKETEQPSSAYPRPQKQHVNVQNVVAQFQSSFRGKGQDTIPSCVFNAGCTAATPPLGGSNEYGNYSANSLVSTVQHLLWKGHCVRIERDLPLATLEDFVQESSSLRNTDCLLYDKQVCLLLLQILMGTQHIYNSASVPELTAREIILVWPGIGGAKGKQEPSEVKIKMKIDQEDAAKQGHIQILWKTLGCPRVVISSQTSALSVSQPFVSFKTQILALIQYCVNAQEGLAALYMSSYRKCLLYLASQLHKNSSLDVNNMMSLLQVILFGPSVPLCLHRCPGTSAVHSWLTVKRTLMVMKLAEKGLDQGLDWEDCLCVQYLSSTKPETVVSAATQLESGLFSLN